MRVTLPRLVGYQLDAFFCPADIAICEASTKAGKTVGAIVWQADKVLRDTRKLNHWWVAPFHPQANIAYSRAKEMLKGIYARSNDTDKKLTFKNGAVWWFKSAEKPDTLYGEDVASVVGDEFTRMREAAHIALLSTVTATEGQIRYIGNVKGRNWGYHIARKAEQGAPGMHYSRITADDAIAAGVINKERVDLIRGQMPHRAFRELYYCEPDDDAGNPFGMEAISDCLTERSEDETAVYGVDLGRSIDSTVVTGLDAGGNWTEAYRFQGEWPEQKRRIASIIGDKDALIDETGLGSPIVSDLKLMCPRVQGFTFTAKSKQNLMERLQAGVQDRAVGIPNGEGFKEWPSEMRSFEYKITRTQVLYAAPEGTGMHDDCVCSLALAYWALGELPRMTSSAEVFAPRRSGWASGQQMAGQAPNYETRWRN